MFPHLVQVLSCEDLPGLWHDVLMTSEDALQTGGCDREQT